MVINPPSQDRRATATLAYAAAIASPVAFSVAAYWLGTTTESVNVAAAVASAASFIIDVFVFYLLRDRLTGLFSAEKHAVGRSSERASVLDEGIYTWMEVLALGVPAVVSLLLVYARAARVIGVDQGGVASFGGADQMAAAAVGSAVIAAGSAYLGHRRRRVLSAPRLHARLRPQVLPLVVGWLACGAWVTYLLGTWRRPTHEMIAAVVVVPTLAYLSAEDLSSTPVRLTLAEPGWWGWLTILVGATTVATTLAWLSAGAMWSGQYPLSTGWITFKVVFSLVPLAVLVGSLGCILADGVQGPSLTLQSPQANMALGQGSYTMLALLAVAIPAYIASRVGAGHHVADAGIIVLGNLGALPALVFSYAWILDNNMEHLAREGATPPRKEYEDYLPESEDERKAAQATQLESLRRHVCQQNYLSVAVLAVAVIWVAARLT